jgi:glycosyltransferase involved in cell wall biosynthesis
MAHHYVMLERVFQRARVRYNSFSCDYLHFPLSRREAVTHVTTLHGRLDIPDLVPLYQEFRDLPVISISNGQREPLPWANWQATVYHGLPADIYRFRPEPGSYLAFLGRISPEKRVDRAIENCEAGRNATQNCSENRSSRPRLFRVGDRAVAT